MMTFLAIFIVFQLIIATCYLRTVWIGNEINRQIRVEHTRLSTMRPLGTAILMLWCWDLKKLLDIRKDRSIWYE